ncbi:MAG: flavin monoamine oxidase family protein [Acidithiobacillus sp.]
MKASAASAECVIVGGGVSGLYAARLLTELGIDWCLLEGRKTAGGRILSPAAPQATASHRSVRRGGFDLGPSWYWPEYQSDLARLVEHLRLEAFPQFELGDMVVERAAAGSPSRLPGYRSVPQSWRLAGGMGALVEGLRGGLDAERIHFGQVVRRLEIHAGQILLIAQDERGETTLWQGSKVLLALPPRLAAQRLVFEPPLAKPLLSDWSAVPTWMAPQAKYLAVYEKPFWREQGLSGEARSALGPLQEIHDASLPDGPAALFGFLGMSARDRRRWPEPDLLDACREHLGRLFGAPAAAPLAQFYKDWAMDPLTATATDADTIADHVPAPSAAPDVGPWAGRIQGIASEWAREYPGYIAGALESATVGVRSISRS